jgi:hypothetical protein
LQDTWLVSQLSLKYDGGASCARRYRLPISTVVSIMTASLHAIADESLAVISGV